MNQSKDFQKLYKLGGNNVQQYIDASTVLHEQNIKMINMQSQISLKNKFDKKVHEMEHKRDSKVESGKQSEGFSVYKQKEEFWGQVNP